MTRFMSAAIEAQNILVEDPGRAAELLETAMQRRGRDLTAEGKLRGDKPEYMDFMNPRFFEEAAKTVQPAGN